MSKSALPLRKVIFTVTWLSLSLGSVAKAAPLYQSTILGQAWPYGITSSGQVLLVKNFQNPTIYNAYGPDAGKRVPVAMTWASSVSPNGMVGGFVENSDFTGTTVLGRADSPRSSPTPIATNFPGAVAAGARNNQYIAAVNDAGQAAGYSETASTAVSPAGGATYHPEHAFFISNGTITDLGTFGGQVSRALGINASGQVVGLAETASGDSHAFLYSQGVMTDLGVQAGYARSWAVAINDSGQVLVASDGPSGMAGFVYKDGVTTDLKGLPGALGMDVKDINNLGEVVGNSFGLGTSTPFLWKDGVTTDLNSLLPSSADFHLTSAMYINEAGQIVAQGIDARGVSQYYLLTPDGLPTPVGAAIPADEVPEPSTIAFTALAAVGFAIRRARSAIGR